MAAQPRLAYALNLKYMTSSVVAFEFSVPDLSPARLEPQVFLPHLKVTCPPRLACPAMESEAFCGRCWITGLSKVLALTLRHMHHKPIKTI